jgi:CubicO group peptidase (beta-lactamase class C family)
MRLPFLMKRPMIASAELRSLLDRVRSRHAVVGATLGVLEGATVDVVASGLLNLNTRDECTPDSVFQIGSIGKVFTATLVLQLRDEGRLKLDDPVIKYLPDFTLADPAAARAVTVRQLLNHTSGIDGDFFPADDSEGPSTVSYIRKMCRLENLYAPGQGPMTYSNSGYVVAGRIVEVLTGMTWQCAVLKRICEPLKMPAVFAHTEQALNFRCATGHPPDPRNPRQPTIAADTYLPISMAAAGTVLTMSAESLLLFAQVHMADGAYDGARLLSAESARKMREDAVRVLPFGVPGVTHWGLGWSLGRAPGYRMAGHNGGTQGHNTYLRTFPDKGVAFALLTNATSLNMFREIEKQLVKSMIGLSLPHNPPAKSFRVDAARYVGRYRNAGASYLITEEGEKLRVRICSNLAYVPEVNATLEPYRRDVFELSGTESPMYEQKISFIDSDKHGHARYVRFGTRMAPVESVK